MSSGLIVGLYGNLGAGVGAPHRCEGLALHSCLRYVGLGQLDLGACEPRCGWANYSVRFRRHKRLAQARTSEESHPGLLVGKRTPFQCDFEP